MVKKKTISKDDISIVVRDVAHLKTNAIVRALLNGEEFTVQDLIRCLSNDSDSNKVMSGSIDLAPTEYLMYVLYEGIFARLTETTNWDYLTIVNLTAEFCDKVSLETERAYAVIRGLASTNVYLRNAIKDLYKGDIDVSFYIRELEQSPENVVIVKGGLLYA